MRVHVRVCVCVCVCRSLEVADVEKERLVDEVEEKEDGEVE